MKPSRKQKIKSNIKDPGAKKRRSANDRNWATEPLTQKQAWQMSNRLARSEAAPVIGQMKSDIRGSRQRQGQIGEWFNQLGTNINEAAAQTDASYAQANSAVQANIEAAQKAAQANQAQIAGGNADFSALVGADPAAFAQPTQEAANAAGQRALTQTMAAAPIAAGGANQAAYLRSLGLNARREGIQQRGLESKRRQEIKADLTAARKAREQMKTGKFLDIRQGERDYSVQRAAFKLDKLGQKYDAASDAADRAYDREQDAIDNRQEQERIGISRSNARDKGGRTPTQKRADRREQQSANVAARNLYTAAKKPPQTQAEWAAFTQLVAAEEGIDPVAARKAVEKLRNSLRGGNRGIPGATQTPYAP